MGADGEELATPPDAGPWKIFLFGAAVPLGITWYAVRAWYQQSALLFGRRDTITMTGDAAKALAVAYLSVAVFLHARWCWGALGFEGVSRVLVAIASVAFVVGLIGAIALELA